jgi:hypothetical protein
MASKEIKERRRLLRELDKYVMSMDLDALRFLVVVAGMRTMTTEELITFREKVLDEKVKRHEQHKARGPAKPR